MGTTLAEKLRAGLRELGLDLSARQQTQLLDYLAMIAKWNKVYNLTAIRDVDEMLTHHLFDSLAIIAPMQKQLHALQARTSKALRLLDVGAGAGLPGVVVAICCPYVAVACVDAVGKKAAFIQQVALALALPNLRGIHSRVEQMRAADVQDGFDVITSRAFAALSTLIDLTANLLVPGAGVWMAMKAKTVDAETAALPTHISVFHVEQLRIPNLQEERCLVWLRPR
ncbi:MAG: 16S rRNA (guanine(527)-N(7))-methyltransferase RsmG [Cytophagales bacterium]|nr:16S rRNA (guanine(527)-N(7))-methyltransferase RsmG [Cytophagales bacterium]